MIVSLSRLPVATGDFIKVATIAIVRKSFCFFNFLILFAKALFYVAPPIDIEEKRFAQRHYKGSLKFLLLIVPEVVVPETSYPDHLEISVA